MSKGKIQTNLLGRQARIKTTEEMWPGTPANEVHGVPLVALLRQFGGQTGEIVTVVREEESTLYGVLTPGGEIAEGLFASAIQILPQEAK